MVINALVLYTVLGLSTITLIDTVGSIASRKLNFKYVYLTPLSLMTFAVVGYLVSKSYNLNIAIMCSSLLGFYDATAGWHLSVLLRANIGLNEGQIKQINTGSRVIGMVTIAALFASVGCMIADSLNN